MTERQICTVSEDLAGQRVDVGLANWLGISRAQAAQLASTGLVELSGKKVGKADRLTAGLQLSAQLPPAEQPAALLGPAALHPLTLLYRDDHLVIVNKPAGLAVHASVGWQGPTVLATLAQQGIALAPSEQLERPGVVHRLDAGTTGVLVVACSTEALNGLKQAFQERTVTKTYHALVQGRLDPPIGIIDAPIGRHPGAAFKFAVRENGKAARTHYRVLTELAGGCLVELGLETGRTHQIRVHLAALGHPLIGDLYYGADPRRFAGLQLNRQALHALNLAFSHPLTGQMISVSSPYPPDFAEALASLQAAAN